MVSLFQGTAEISMAFCSKDSPCHSRTVCHTFSFILLASSNHISERTQRGDFQVQPDVIIEDFKATSEAFWDFFPVLVMSQEINFNLESVAANI